MQSWMAELGDEQLDLVLHYNWLVCPQKRLPKEVQAMTPTPWRVDLDALWSA